MSGAVSVKTERYQLYVSMMWRGKPHARGTILPDRANNLSKVDYRGLWGQVGSVPTEDQDGVWSLVYGDLAVGMNTHMQSELDGARTWTLPPSLHNVAVVDLVDGKEWAVAPSSILLKAQEAVVLRATTAQLS